MGVPIMMILLQKKSFICIWMERDNLTLAVFNIKVKIWIHSTQVPKQLQILSKQRKGTGNKQNFFTYTYNVKCKLSVLKHHEGILGNRSIMQHILNLSTRHEWSTPYPDHFTQGEWDCGTAWKRQVSSRASLDVLENRQTPFHCWGVETMSYLST
jgi:hypothetical protein